MLDNKKIKVTVTKNPKRPRSKAYEKFRLLMKYNGKHVADFKAEEGRHPKLDIEKRWPTVELRWARHLGLVKLTSR